MLAFALVAAVALGSALGLVLRRNPIHAALLLVVHLGSIAALYLLLGAEFLAAAQVIVYAGAIVVLFVFAIMVLVPGRAEVLPDELRRWRRLAPAGGALLLVVLAAALGRGPAPPPPAAPVQGTVEALGRRLFTDWLLPFELVSVILLAAMVGVLLLARRRT